MALTQVPSGMLATGAALANIGTNGITPSYLDSNAQYTGFKNKLINGSFQIWQRATTSTASGYVCADRWSMSGSGNVTQARSSSPDSPNGNYSLVCTSNSASTYTNVSQAIENVNVYPLRGKTVTVSFYIKLNSGSFAGQLGIVLYYSNSVDTLNLSTGGISASSGTAYATPVSGSWTRISAVYAIPSDAVGLSFQMNVSSAQASGTSWSYADAQIEIGSVATSFDQRDYGRELILCQRYYQVSNSITGVAAAPDLFRGIVPYIVNMRANPTVNLTAPFSVTDLYSGSWTQSSASITLNQSQVNNSYLTMGNFGSSLTPTRVQIAYSTTAAITLSAEL
jgi:hypothetical protein